MYTAEFLSCHGVSLPLAGAMIVALLSGCTQNVHTFENTADMTSDELFALCQDLEMRASQDCAWNLRQQQSSLENRQTWEVNCLARRDSARRSYENVCLDERTERPEPPE
jgi:hypothetical protein